MHDRSGLAGISRGEGEKEMIRNIKGVWKIGKGKVRKEKKTAKS